MCVSETKIVKVGDNMQLSFQGAGHMVPQWAPGPSLHMLDHFLANKPY